ncbi:MAG: endonuclease MutS2 [Erysipelotrichaceae bacterium]|nr:endonuclease MutS2 [Erysipelotrichaceae bacterium]
MNQDVLELKTIQQIITRYCSFQGGVDLVLEEVPSFSRLVVKTRLDRMKEALACTYRYGSMPFYGVKEIRPAILIASKQGILTCEELLNVADHESCVQGCISYLNGCECEKEHLTDLTDSLVAHPKITQRIRLCIANSHEVSDSASPKLASLRKQIRSVLSSMDSTLANYIRSHSAYLQDTISATRNDRAVVLVKNTYKNQLEGIQYGESASGLAAYMEPSCMIPLNNQLQSLRQKEEQEIERILKELTELVGEQADSYLANMETLALLDMLFAKAQYGRETEGCVAGLSEDDTLFLRSARHPLISKKTVVANTYRIVPPYTTLLITGPNTGGKTVSLKTMGLFVLMTYCGIPVGCLEATVPMYDNVFVDIGDSQSIEQSLSTFSGHIANLSEIFKNATRKSLVILDELCSGTDPKEGENLAIAILEALRNRKIFVIASTHYSKLKAYGKQHEDILLASVEFDMELLQPTYRYLEGFTGQSNAFDIALRYGFEKDIIDHAKQLKKEDATRQDELLELLEQQSIRQQQYLDQLAEKNMQVQKAQEALQKKQQEFMDQEDALLQQAKDKAELYLEEVRQQASEILDDLKMRQSIKMHEAIEVMHELNDLSEVEEEEETEIDTTIKQGDTVRVLKTNYLAEVLSISSKSATVLCNGLRMKVDLDGLKKETKKKPEPKKKESVRYTHNRSSFSIECNLIGMRVEEAMVVLSKYMDDAILANVSFVRIIHGHGTGALRKAVWDYLKRCKGVKGYRLGGMSEGGTGATVVMLKES